ncbi:hypothetical protein [Campylobacter hyointestinalis]|nr:hypothetical protein [Campylobacter hyointestinalis]
MKYKIFLILSQKTAKKERKNLAKNSNDEISILGIYKENEWSE